MISLVARSRDADWLRNDPADIAEIRALNEELDEISAR
jgi:hypothetical protein